jgi:hypothetical protein
MSDEERDQQEPEGPERDAAGFDPDGNISYGIDKDGFFHIDGHQQEKVEQEPATDPVGGTVQIGGRTYSTDELEQAIQRASEAEEKIRQAEQLRETLAPFEPILSHERFNDLLEELAEEGVGPAYPTFQPEDTAGVSARWEMEGSADIHEDVVRHAQSLPDHMQTAIDSNPKLYNELFDRVAKAKGEQVKGRPSLSSMKRRAEQPRQDVLSHLRSKEVLKDRAAVEKPGVARFSDYDAEPSGKRSEHIYTLAKQGNEDAILEVAKSFFPSDPPKVKKSGF